MITPAWRCASRDSKERKSIQLEDTLWQWCLWLFCAVSCYVVLQSSLHPSLAGALKAEASNLSGMEMLLWRADPHGRAALHGCSSAAQEQSHGVLQHVLPCWHPPRQQARRPGFLGAQTLVLQCLEIMHPTQILPWGLIMSLKAQLCQCALQEEILGLLHRRPDISTKH